MRPAICGLVLALTAIAFAVAADARQAARGSISGIVVDRYGARLSGATVYAKRIATEAERTATTDANGRYHLDDLVAGEYQVLALAPSMVGRTREHVRVEVGEVALDPFVLKGPLICECTVSPDPERTPGAQFGAVRLRHHDAAGNRLIKAWVAFNRQPWNEPYAVGPFAACVCLKRPETMGREEYFNFDPGTYMLRGAAAGYASWTRTGIIVSAGKTTDIEVTWEVRVTADDESQARAELRPSEQLIRVETFDSTMWFAIDAMLAESSALLDAIDRHEFDDSQLIRDATDTSLGVIRVWFDNQLPDHPLAISQEQSGAPEVLRIGSRTVGRRLDAGSRLRLPDAPGRVRVMAVTRLGRR